MYNDLIDTNDSVYRFSRTFFLNISIIIESELLKLNINPIDNVVIINEWASWINE